MKYPKICPLLEECECKLTKGEFESFCLTEEWIYCPEVPDDIKQKYLKKPKEWFGEMKREIRKLI